MTRGVRSSVSTSPDKQRLRWILGGYMVATDLDVMISVNRDLGGGDVVQETDPNIGGVNPTAPWNERFVAAVAPVFTANPGAIPPSCLRGPLPAPVCAANLANPNQNAARAVLQLRPQRQQRVRDLRTDELRCERACRGVARAPLRPRRSAAHDHGAADQYLPVFPFPSGREGDVRDEVFDAWQPKATIRWKPNDALSVYGVYAQGFRSGGFNLSGVAAGVAALRSAGVPGMPAGVRGFLGPGRHARRGVRRQVESAARRRELRCLRLSIRASTTRSRSSSSRRSTRRSSATSTRRRSAGFEADVSWLPVSGLQLDFAVGLLNSEILDTTWVGTGGVDITGKELPFNPNSTINAGVGYSRPVPGGWQGFGRFDYERLGRTPFDPENFAFRDPVHLLNLSGGVTAPGGWEVAIWARNLTNKDYLAESINPNGISWLARPRQWGLELTKRF